MSRTIGAYLPVGAAVWRFHAGSPTPVSDIMRRNIAESLKFGIAFTRCLTRQSPSQVLPTKNARTPRIDKCRTFGRYRRDLHNTPNHAAVRNSCTHSI